jgi:hypothetical protein
MRDMKKRVKDDTLFVRGSDAFRSGWAVIFLFSSHARIREVCMIHPSGMSLSGKERMLWNLLFLIGASLSGFFVPVLHLDAIVADDCRNFNACIRFHTGQHSMNCIKPLSLVEGVVYLMSVSMFWVR